MSGIIATECGDEYYEYYSDDVESPSVKTIDITDPGADNSRNSLIKNPQFLIGLILTVTIGATNALFLKWIYAQPTKPCSPDDDCELSPYSGWLMVAILRYCWMAFFGCCTYYGIDVGLLHNRGKNPILTSSKDIENAITDKKVKARFFISSFFDVGFVIFSMLASQYTLPSLSAAIGSSQIMFAALFDLIISRRTLTTGKLLGLLVILVGLVLYVLDKVLFSDSSSMAKNPALGAFMALLASIARAMHASVQGKFLAKYRMPPMKAVFIESCCSLTWTAVACNVFHFSGMTSMKTEWFMFVNNPTITGSVIAYAMMGFLFSGGAVLCGKFVSGLFRMVILQFAAILVWCLELALGWGPFTTLTFLGWTIICLGVVMYGGINQKMRTKAPWYFRPLLCCGFLIPPPDAILSPKQLAKQSR